MQWVQPLRMCFIWCSAPETICSFLAFKLSTSKCKIDTDLMDYYTVKEVNKMHIQIKQWMLWIQLFGRMMY